MDATNREYYRPKNWQDFERLIKSIFSEVNGRSPFQRYGKGYFECQHGVDIFGRSKENKLIGIQCKNRHSELNRDLKRNEIIAEVMLQKSFPKNWMNTIL